MFLGNDKQPSSGFYMFWMGIDERERMGEFHHGI